MSNDKIRIVATDGNEIKTVAAINRTTDLVFTPVSKSHESYHITYHENGLLHLKRWPNTDRQSTRDICYGPPLNRLQGFVWLETLTPLNDSIFPHSHALPYNKGEYDSIIYIDIQGGEYGREYAGFICEAGFPVGKTIKRQLSNASSFPDTEPKLSYQVYTGIDPWVGIAHWNESTTLKPSGFTNHFRPMGHYVDIRATEDPYPDPCPNGKKGCAGHEGTGPLCRDCYEEISDE